MTLRPLTKSRMASYRACQRLHYYTYDQGYRAQRESDAMHTGTLGHTGLEAWWLAAKAGGDADVRLTAALAAIAHEPDPYEYARMFVLLSGYTERWGAEELDVVGVEVEFTCPIVNPDTDAPSRTFALAGKIDAVARRDGKLFIVEHKFSGEDTSPGSNYWRRLKIDQQISAYYEGARALYGDVWGCIYDVIAKPTTRPLKATPAESRKLKKDGSLYASQRDRDETPDEYATRLSEIIIADPASYFVRGEVVRLDEDMRDAQFDIWQTARGLRESELAKHWPRNPDACSRFGRTCEFLPVCCREASIDDPSLFRRVDNVNEELVQLGCLTPKEEGIENVATANHTTPA